MRPRLNIFTICGLSVGSVSPLSSLSVSVVSYSLNSRLLGIMVLARVVGSLSKLICIMSLCCNCSNGVLLLNTITCPLTGCVLPLYFLLVIDCPKSLNFSITFAIWFPFSSKLSY